MWEFVTSGGYFNKESLRKHNPHRTSLIAIARVRAGTQNFGLRSHDGHYYFIRDGHHRCCIAHLFRGCLREDEYTVEDRSIEDFEAVNFECGWVTPFNPITEVRLADFHSYKSSVLALIAGKTHDSLIHGVITEGKKLYCTQRIDSMSRLESMAHELWVHTLQDEYGRGS